MQIKCKRCGKLIEKKGNREYCIRCRNVMDRERMKVRREMLSEEEKEKIRTRGREYSRRKQARLNREW